MLDSKTVSLPASGASFLAYRHNRPSRRFVLAGLCLLVLTVAASRPAFSSASAIQAREVLQASVSRILSLLQNPGYVNPRTREPLRLQIEDEVYHCFDFAAFSARTVGSAWRKFTPAQRERFTEAFAELLFSTYLNHIDGYNGEEVRYTGERRNQAGTRVEVATELAMMDGRVIPVSYRMMPRRGTWAVYDVVIDGVSLVLNYRTQFQDILSSSTPDEVIELVKTRAREVADNASH